jgi:hypothetical protein
MPQGVALFSWLTADRPLLPSDHDFVITLAGLIQLPPHP